MRIKFTLHFQGEEMEDGDIEQKSLLKTLFSPPQNLGKELKLEESEQNKTFYKLGHVALHLMLSNTHRAEWLSEINLNCWLLVILLNH